MAIARRTRSSRVWVWVISIAIVCAVFLVARAMTRSTLTVSVYTVRRGSIKSTLSTNGKMQPINNYEVHAPFAGLVKTLNVHEGDRVQQGELLLTLDDADARTRLDSAVAALDGARANAAALTQGGTQEERLSLGGDLAHTQSELTQAQQSLATLEKLQAQGAASPSEVAAARSRVSNDQASLGVLQQRKTSRYNAADLTHASATVTEAEAAVTAAQEAIANANVRAPFDGTVYSLSASRTEYVQQGDRLMQIANLSHMEVLAYFDEPDIGKLTVGQPVTIGWVAMPEKLWHGHISRLPSTIVTYTTRNVGEVQCTIDDADGDLLPNTNVNVTVTTANLPDALYVPREALHSEQGLSYVYRVAGGKLKRTRVEVGQLNLTQIQVTSGLKDGDVVALGSTTGQPLVNGIPVETAP